MEMGAGFACKYTRCLWFVTDADSGELVLLVKRVVDPDDMRAEVEYMGTVEEFLKRLRKAFEMGLVSEIIIPANRAEPEEIIKILRG